jgi:hypothetical protein
MPWKECHVMDERLRLWPACSRARRWRRCAPRSGSPARPATRSSNGTRTAASRRSRIAAGDPYRQANRLPPQLEAVIVRLKREYPRLGGAEDPREAAAAVDRAAACRPSAPCMPCSDRHGLGPAAAAPPPQSDRAPRCRGPVRAERAVVRRLQGRVHARRSALLLPADDHDFREPLPADV